LKIFTVTAKEYQPVGGHSLYGLVCSANNKDHALVLFEHEFGEHIQKLIDVQVEEGLSYNKIITGLFNKDLLDKIKNISTFDRISLKGQFKTGI
jgi:hypothetical protein